jgi:AcrR family transcriptional regulator
MSDRKTQEERNAQTRAGLLNAALEVIFADGIAAIRVTDIAERAGVTTGAIQHQFGNREGLVLAVLKHIFDLFNSQIVPLEPVESIRDRMLVVNAHLSLSRTIRLYLILSDVLIGSRADLTLRSNVSAFVRDQASTFDEWWLSYINDLRMSRSEALGIGRVYKAAVYGIAIEASHRARPEAFFRRSTAALTEMMICTLQVKANERR